MLSTHMFSGFFLNLKSINLLKILSFNTKSVLVRIILDVLFVICQRNSLYLKKRTDAVFTLQEFCVYEQLQRQEEHHQDDTGHQDTVEAGAEQTDLPQGYTATTTRLQPV